jgi:hypothetical protein
VRRSLELERQWRGEAMVEEGGGGELHGAQVLERGRDLESGVKSCVVLWGCSSPFIGAREGPARWQ